MYFFLFSADKPVPSTSQVEIDDDELLNLGEEIDKLAVEQPKEEVEPKGQATAGPAVLSAYKGMLQSIFYFLLGYKSH